MVKNQFGMLVAGLLLLSACGQTSPTAVQTAQQAIYKGLVAEVEASNNSAQPMAQGLSTLTLTDDTSTDSTGDVYLELVPDLQTNSVTPTEIQVPSLPVDSTTGTVPMTDEVRAALNTYANDLAQIITDGTATMESATLSAQAVDGTITTNEGMLSPLGISYSKCSRRVDYAHVSGTAAVRGSVIVKGAITCTPSKNRIYVVTQMMLYKAGNLYSQGPQRSFLTSATANTGLSDYDYYAYGPCISDNYNGHSIARYSNTEGGIIAIAAPLVGNTRYVKCGS